MTNDTKAPTLTEFLLARVAEDEAVARDATGSNWEYEPVSGDVKVLDGPSLMDYPDMSEQDARHVVRHDPARILAECDMKKKVANYFVALTIERERSEEAHAQFRSIRWVIERMAAVYSDHPDYRQEWAL